VTRVAGGAAAGRRAKGLCFACKASGHQVGECPVLKRFVDATGTAGAAGTRAQSVNLVEDDGASADDTPHDCEYSALCVSAANVVDDGTLRECAFVADGTAVDASVSGPSVTCVDWVVDSGASSHMTGDKSVLSGLYKLATPLAVTVANGTVLMCDMVGTVSLSFADGGHVVSLQHVLYVPGLNRNLLSVAAAVEGAGVTVTFTSGVCTIRSPVTGRSLLTATRCGPSRLYVVDGCVSVPVGDTGGVDVAMVVSHVHPDTSVLWHISGLVMALSGDCFACMTAGL
jgi:hypothetical protein